MKMTLGSTSTAGVMMFLLLVIMSTCNVRLTSGFAPKHSSYPHVSIARNYPTWTTNNSNNFDPVKVNMAVAAGGGGGNQQVDNLDTDFENVNLLRLLGLRRVKKFVKKRQSVARKAAFLDQESMSTTAAANQSVDASTSSSSSSNGREQSGTKKPLKLIIAGAPASGKGTQCEIIKKKYGVVHLSTGDMLRAAVAAGTEVGKQAKEFMDAGKLVPDEVIIGVVANRLEQNDCKTQGWLLDGFPRTPGQADALASAGITADCFIFLNVPDDILVDRVVGRRTDPVTGKIYHITYSPPDEEEVLARLEQRSDDTEDKVKVRLEQFHANVDAVKGSYSDVAVEIDGTASPQDVSKAIAAAIASRVSA